MDHRHLARHLAALMILAGILGTTTSCQGIFQFYRPAPRADYRCVASVNGPAARPAAAVVEDGPRDASVPAAETSAEPTDGSLRVGFAEADITPSSDPYPYLGGFDLARRATGVHSPLRARVMVLELAGQRFAIVGIDNLGVMHEDVDWIKSALYGFANGNVFVCASHTHYAPDLIGMWGWYFMTSGRDPRYLSLVRARIAEAVQRARAEAVPARLRVARGFIAEGLFRNSNRRENYDRRAVALQALALDDGRPLGALLNAACHPESLKRRDSRVSADWVGALCDSWSARGLGQPVFVNGALGAMVAPNPKEDAGCRLIGESVAETLATALENAVDLEVDEIEVRRRDVYLQVESLALSIARVATVLPRELYQGALRAPVGYLRIGSGADAFEAVTVPGEMEPGLAARVRARMRRPELVVFGLCDDEVGYLMSERDARSELFSYERVMSPEVQAGEKVLRALAGPPRQLVLNGFVPSAN